MVAEGEALEEVAVDEGEWAAEALVLADVDQFVANQWERFLSLREVDPVAQSYPGGPAQRKADFVLEGCQQAAQWGRDPGNGENADGPRIGEAEFAGEREFGWTQGTPVALNELFTP